jgi:2-isopropylmalate synthase
MTVTERLYIYDTTLRDGQQTQGVTFSLEDKNRISNLLDNLGVDYIEGGWPGANPTDSDFFDQKNSFINAKLVAFGMTKRFGRSAENDEVLSEIVNSRTSVVCLVGKSHEFHVKQALGISLEENMELIVSSISYLKSLGKEVHFDAEHFFDGFLSDPQYSTRIVQEALKAGAKWVILCDTNGGCMPDQIYSTVQELSKAGVDTNKLGIHAHNDTENAVANSLAAVSAGVRQIQGTLNGLGERCGNANLISIIPTLLLKKPFADKFHTGITIANLKELTRASRLMDDVLNRVPNRFAPYVGSSAFAHKAGLHASAILKNTDTYEHISPDIVGNERIIPVSNQAGQSNLRERLLQAGIEVSKDDTRLSELLKQIKEKENQGFSFDSASASFEIFARKILNQMPSFFEVKRYRVTTERRIDALGNMNTLSEAVVVVKIGENETLSVSESMDERLNDLGPVNALAKAIGKDLGKYQDIINDLKLVDFKVRITSGGTSAVTRVLIDSEDSKGTRWSTVGVSANILDASFQALLDSINWKLIKEGATPN